MRDHFGEGLDPEIAAATEEAIRLFRSLGATIHDIELPHSKYGIATYYIIAPCEASSNLARYDGVHYGYRTDEDDDAGANLEQERSEASTRTTSTRHWCACTARRVPRDLEPK